MRAVFFVSVGAQGDITGRIEEYLTSINIRLTAKSRSDTLEIALANPNGVIQLPRKGEKIQAGIGWEDGPPVVFEGKIDKVTATGARGGGRTLTISATSTDRTGKLKDRKEKHADKGTLKETAEKFGKEAGVTVKVDETLGKIERAYWAMRNETFMAWGARIAREVGATFKIMDDVAVFIARGSGKSASGQDLVPIRAAVGENLITWSLTPYEDEPRYQKIRGRYYDRDEAKWKTEEIEVEAEGLTASRSLRWASPDKDQAKARAGSNETDSKREKGGGSVTLVGAPEAQPEAPCEVAGTEDGTEGTYRIDSVDHKLARGAGFETTLELKEPGEGVGDGDEGESSSEE